MVCVCLFMCMNTFMYIVVCAIREAAAQGGPKGDLPMTFEVIHMMAISSEDTQKYLPFMSFFSLDCLMPSSEKFLNFAGPVRDLTGNRAELFCSIYSLLSQDTKRRPHILLLCPFLCQPSSVFASLILPDASLDRRRALHQVLDSSWQGILKRVRLF